MSEAREREANKICDGANLSVELKLAEQITTAELRLPCESHIHTQILVEVMRILVHPPLTPVDPLQLSRISS